MERTYRVAAALYLVIAVSACKGGHTDITGLVGGGGGGGARAKSITTAAEAKTLFNQLKASGEAVDRQLAATFTGTTSINGVSGRAAVNGKKTVSRSESLSSTSTTRVTDVGIDFSQYRSSAASVRISGLARWYDHYYSRTACSAFSCASNTDESLSMTGTIHVEFQHAGESYEDDISLDVKRPKDRSSWTVKITTRDGNVLSFSM